MRIGILKILWLRMSEVIKEFTAWGVGDHEFGEETDAVSTTKRSLLLEWE